MQVTRRRQSWHSRPMPSATSAATWFRAAPAPLVLISGPELVLAERAIEAIVSQVRKDREADVIRLDAAAYTSGSLLAATSPSLFGEPGVVVCEGVHTMNDDFLADALAYCAHADPSTVVVFQHGGGVRGKKLLDTLRSARAPEYTCPAVKRESEVVDFATGEFERAGRTIAAPAVRALVDAVGTDIAEVAAACQQLMNDVDGTVDEATVALYYGTRVNATGFRVADAVVAGKVDEALALARHALNTGTDPVPLIAALASKLRILAKVGATRGRSLDPVRDLGLAPWQVDRARKELAIWSADTLAAAIEATAQADAQIKGQGRVPEYALERAVRDVATLAGASR